MALIEKVAQIDDLYLYEIFKNPVLYGEFINSYDKLEWEESFEFTWYQKEILCDFNSYADICTARATGKTVSLSNFITWILVNNIFPMDYIVYTVPNKVHLEPVFTSLTRMFRSNSFLKQMISPNAGINSSTHTITLLNSAVLICRIAGQTGTGANVIGLHTPVVLLDEGGYYPWGTWVELQPTLNTFTKGFKLMVAGVPTGLRENNVLYHTDMENSNYTKHRVSAYDNPRFTVEDEARAVEQYGSKENDDFVHLVLGQHGAPIFAVFDRRLLEVESYPVYKLVIDGIKLQDNLGEYQTKLSFLPAVSEKTKILMGIDLGYTDPTAIVILTEGRNGQLRFHARVQLNKVSYNIQDKIIDWLDTKFRPSTIGVDEGSSGLAVTQRLLESDDYLHKDYKKRLVSVNFASMTSLGFDSDGNELKQRTKPFYVSVLQNYSNNHKIVYSSTDVELIAELERMTYSKSVSGDIQYKTLTPKGGKRGEDHFTSALLCAGVAYYLQNETLIANKKPVKLFSARWLGK